MMNILNKTTVFTVTPVESVNSDISQSVATVTERNPAALCADRNIDGNSCAFN